jgi:hypothetical protein
MVASLEGKPLLPTCDRLLIRQRVIQARGSTESRNETQDQLDAVALRERAPASTRISVCACATGQAHPPHEVSDVQGIIGTHREAIGRAGDHTHVFTRCATAAPQQYKMVAPAPTTATGEISRAAKVFTQSLRSRFIEINWWS